MLRTPLKKQSSYSQFRKKNSLTKNNLHKSMLDIDNSISLIADEKTQELLSIENQLQFLVRNRSLSAKPSAKCHTEESTNSVFDKKISLTTDDGALHIVKRSSIHSLTTIEHYQKPNLSKQFQSFNQTFQIIEESDVQNQEDNGLYDSNQLNNKIITSKPGSQNEKNAINKRKNSNQLIQSLKTQTKATIKDLDQMQKRLQSAKKKNKLDPKDKKIVKKSQIPSKVPPHKIERRIQRIASEAVLATDSVKLKGLQILKEKELTPKPNMRKKFPLAQSVKQPIQPQKELGHELIPTKMINSQQKQKLLKQFDKVKQAIKGSDICADNMQQIRSLLKSIKGLIN